MSFPANNRLAVLAFTLLNGRLDAYQPTNAGHPHQTFLVFVGARKGECFQEVVGIGRWAEIHRGEYKEYNSQSPRHVCNEL